MTPTTSTALAGLFSAGPSMLTDKEVRTSLRAELDRERAAADRAMREVIAEAEKRVTYLSSAIFDPIEKIEGWTAKARAAVPRAVEKAKTKTEGALYLSIVKAIAHKSEVELDTARKLRALRLPVSHTDPASYWDDLRAYRNSLPIIIRGRA
jgi:uncharacterized ferritin-like protein (DUF455 family)